MPKNLAKQKLYLEKLPEPNTIENQNEPREKFALWAEPIYRFQKVRKLFIWFESIRNYKSSQSEQFYLQRQIFVWLILIFNSVRFKCVVAMGSLLYTAT